MSVKTLGPSVGVATAVMMFWILGAAFFPVIQDEAYYAVWAHHLAWGYFDHPPAVALLGQLNRVLPSSALALRIGTLVAGLLTVWTSVRLFSVLGLTGKRQLAVALALLFGNLLGLVFGFLSTPDTLLMLAWSLAMHEAGVALTRDERRWVTAGLVTGLGFLAKYTMTLIGPAFLWALIGATQRGRKGGLKSPWPYAGGLAALLVCAPHLMWNAQHDWITVRFQFRHGLAMARPEMRDMGLLPAPRPTQPGTPEYALATPFLALEKTEKRWKKPPTAWDDLVQSVERYVGYYVSQGLLWGGCLLAIVPAWRRRSSVRTKAPEAGDSPPLPIQRLVIACALVPLIVCGLLSLTSKVEANWSAMYVFGAAAWLAPWVYPEWRRLRWGVAVNMLLALALVVHARHGLLPIRPSQDRILAETHGYSALALEVQNRGLATPVFAETYQIAAMLRFYAPHVVVSQWPGLTRDSEFVRNPLLLPRGAQDVTQAGGFWLVTTQVLPPRLLPYAAVEMIHLRDCQGPNLQVITSPIVLGPMGSICQRPIHKWYMVRYAYGPAT